jgi:hypothetical protein
LLRLVAWNSILTVARGTGAPGGTVVVPRKPENASRDRLQETFGKHTDGTSRRMGRMRSTSKEITGPMGFRSLLAKSFVFLPKTECKIVQAVQVSSISWL